MKTLQEATEELVKKIKDEMYDEDLEDLGAEAISDHVYESKFEAFRFGYNQACKEIITLLSPPTPE